MLLALVASTVVRVSVATDGTPANQSCFLPAISGDGRFVVYASLASNLSPGDTNQTDDVFLRDLANGTTECLTCEPRRGGTSPAISPDGRYVSYVRLDTIHLLGGFVLDRVTGVETYVEWWVGSVSERTVAGGDYAQSYVRDLRTGATEQITRLPAGWESEIQAFSRSGRFVAYQSFDWNESPWIPYHTHLLDLSTGSLEVIDDGSGAGTVSTTLSADGRYACYSQWMGGSLTDVILYDRRDGSRTTLAENAVHPRMTPDARFVVFESGGITVLDRSTGRLDVGPQGWDPSISDDGSRVAFAGALPDRGGTNVCPDIYLWTR